MDSRHQNSHALNSSYEMHCMLPAHLPSTDGRQHFQLTDLNERPLGYESTDPTHMARSTVYAPYPLHSRIQYDVPGRGLDELRQVVKSTGSPKDKPSQPTHLGGAGASVGTSFTFKAVSILGMILFPPYVMRTLMRPTDDCKAAVVNKMRELGVRWTERPDLDFECEYGIEGTSDYIFFAVLWFSRNRPGIMPQDLFRNVPQRTGPVPWRTQLYVQRKRGSFQTFRTIGRQILEAARYEKHGSTVYDHAAHEVIFDRHP